MTRTEYITLDNGGEPYRVVINTENKNLTVFHRPYVNDGDIDETKEHSVFESSYSNIWIGKDVLELGSQGSNRIGNSIVVQTTASHYVFIGSEIVKFSLMPNDSIKVFQSPVGNSGVPYPYIIGETHTYFLLDFIAIPNERLNLTNDAYDQFYGFAPGPNGLKQKLRKFGQKLTVIRLHSP
jgi:hypothetical protein